MAMLQAAPSVLSFLRMSASSRSLRSYRKLVYAGPYRKSVFSFAFIARSLLRNTATTCTFSFRAVFNHLRSYRN